MTFSVTILGSSSALPTSKRFPAAHVFNTHERLFLVDCGEGTQIQLRKYKLKLSRLERIFISHLHGDHVLGIFGLISTLNLLGRKAPLAIYAHQEFEPILNKNINFFINNLQFAISFIPIEANQKKSILFEDQQIIVETFPLKHRIPCNGFIFKEKEKTPNIKKHLIEKYCIPLSEIVRIKQGANFTLPTGKVIPNSELTYLSSSPRSYAYCSDTMFFSKLAEYVKNVDLLYHEATFGSEMASLAKQTGHSTASDAAKIASLAKVKKLVIGHFSSRYKDIDPLLTEAQQIFPNTSAATEGDIFKIEANRVKL